jgi:hypothetical protein
MDKKFYRGVIFCSHPVTGFYSFEDKFQIFPLTSPHAPRSDKVPGHPLVIEYWIDKSAEPAPEEMKHLSEIAQDIPLVHGMTQNVNYQNRIRNLLSAISNYRFYFKTPSIEWMNEIPDTKPEPGKPLPPSKPGLATYYYYEMGQENFIDKFSSQNSADIRRVKHPDCFMHIDTEGREEVQFSEHIDAAIHNYFALSGEERKVVDSAATLLCYGIDLLNSMKSLSYVALISSIETMVNHENKGVKIDHCKECSQELFKVMAKFRDYLFKYVTDNESTKKEINALYSIRSKIAHTGMLLLGDDNIDWSTFDKQSDQWLTHIQVIQLARVSLTNWLLSRR